MAYCSPTDVRALIPLIDENTMADMQIEVYIKRACNLIDAKLRDTYIVPFDPIPELIKDIAAEYSSYLVLRTIYSQNSPNTHEMVDALKESAEALLNDLAEGELQIEALSYSGIESTTEFEKKIFTLEDITPLIKRY